MSEYIVCPYCHNPLSQSEYVKVVRCRDCKFYDTDWESEAHPGRLWCDESWHYREPDGFCKWGERRDA